MLPCQIVNLNKTTRFRMIVLKMMGKTAAQFHWATPLVLIMMIFQNVVNLKHLHRKM